MQEPVKICLVNFVFTLNGHKHKVDGVVAKRLPKFLLENELSYKTALGRLPNRTKKEMKTNKDVHDFEVTFLKNIGLHHHNPYEENE